MYIMKYGKLVVVIFLVAVGSLLVGVSASAATDYQVYSNSSYTVYLHSYSGASTSYDEQFAITSGVWPNLFTYYIEWPVSVDVFLAIPTNSSDTSTVSGYLQIPLNYGYDFNSDLQEAIIDGTFRGTSKVLDYNLTPNFSNTDNISFSMTSKNGQRYLTLLLDHVPCSSLAKGDNKFCISANFVFSGGFSIQSEYNYLLDKGGVIDYGALYSPLHYVNMWTSSSSSWLSSLSVGSTALATDIASAINSATDVDSIIAGLSSLESLSSDILIQVTTLLSTRNLKYAINQATSIQTIVSYLGAISDDTTKLDDVISALDPAVLAQAIDGSSDVDSILSLLTTISTNSEVLSSVFSSLTDLNYTMSCIYTDFESYLSQITSYHSDWDGSISKITDIHLLLNRLAYAFSGGVAVSNREAYLAGVTNNWINIIKEALSDFEITVNVSDDEIVNIEVTNNDVTNIYNDQQIIQNFETDIQLNFNSSFDDIDWTILNNDSDIVTVDFIQTNYIGGSLIQRMYNALGPYNVLVTITLFVGLVSALIGPINAFIGSKIH